MTRRTAAEIEGDRRTNGFDDLEKSYGKVESLKRELDPAEERLEEVRGKVWRALGADPFGRVKVGGFRFSRLMVIVGVAFTAGVMGTMIAPLAGFMLAGIAVAGGIMWIRSKV